MKVLLVKTSSMGDIIHTFPAVAEAHYYFPELELDWVIEESFSSLLTLLPTVRKIIPLNLRRWKKNIFAKTTIREVKIFMKSLRAKSYDYVIDGQGLLKSAIITRLADGIKVGLDKDSLTEPCARFFYQKKLTVELNSQAIMRMKSIFSQTLQYPYNSEMIDYGIDLKELKKPTLKLKKPYTIFLHSTTWPTKHWPTSHWIELANLFILDDSKIVLFHNSDKELERCYKIKNSCQQLKNIIILPRLNLLEVAYIINNAEFVITLDTGLGHLASALDIPTIFLYGPSSYKKSGGIFRADKYYLTSKLNCSPCFRRKKCLYKDQDTIHSKCLQQIMPVDLYKILTEKFRKKD